MRITLPENVKTIIHILEQNGFEAYAVGGCVRDSILGRKPQDWDITTSAKPQQVKALFSHTIDTGIEHGTVTVMQNRVGYEVTTYRIDGEYEDSRHPKEVIFTANLVEDLKRRDFTINAMAYNDSSGLVDAFSGIEDLEAGVIRCVGDATKRLEEDALRMLRAVRFAASLGFTIDDETKEAIRVLAPTIAKVSAERIQVEMVKLLTSPHPEEMRQVYELGLSKIFLPEWDRMMETMQHSPHHCYTVGEHTIHTLMNIKNDKVLRIAMLLHDVAKPLCIRVANGREHYDGHPAMGAEMAKQILRRLKFDNDTIKKVAHLVLYHDERPALDMISIRRAIAQIGVEECEDLFLVKYADLMGQSDYRRKEKTDYVKAFEENYRLILKNEDCVRRADLAISGNDLIALGMKPGKEIGEVLSKLFDMVLEEPSYNTKEKLTELVHNMKPPFIR